VVKYVGLPDIDIHDMLIDLNKVIKLYTEQYALWAKECTRVTDAKPGQVQQFAEHPNQSQNHASEIELQPRKVSGARNKHQGNICNSNGTT
jgi:hypothetical protein